MSSYKMHSSMNRFLHKGIQDKPKRNRSLYCDNRLIEIFNLSDRLMPKKSQLEYFPLHGFYINITWQNDIQNPIVFRAQII